MPLSSDNAECNRLSRRPTLPPIRDLFREELGQLPRQREEPRGATPRPYSLGDEEDRSFPSRRDRFEQSMGRTVLPSFGSMTHSGDQSTRRAQSGVGLGSGIELSDPTRRPRASSSAASLQSSGVSSTLALDQLAYQYAPQTFPPYSDGSSGFYCPPPMQASTSQHNHSSAFPTQNRLAPLRPSVPVYSDRPRVIDPDEHSAGISMSFIQLRHDSQTPTPGSSPGTVGNTIPNSQSKYECKFCGKGFARPSSLKIHLNSHTGEKPFVCPAEGCGRSFSVRSNMTRHYRGHSQAEPSSDESGYTDNQPG